MSTFVQLRTEAAARGLAYLNDGGAGLTRLNAFINQAYRELCELEDWPFLQTTTTGPAPLTITDLRDIIYVASATGEIPGRDVGVFLDTDPLLTQTGTVQYWWLDGQTILRAWPLDTTTQLTVRYVKAPADLTADADVPVIPTRYHSLIVDFAVIRGLRDRSNFTEATALRQAIEPELNSMRDALLDESDWFQRQTEPSNA